MQRTAVAVFGLAMAACGSSAPESETIPDPVLEQSDPQADTSGSPVLSRGGCGGWLNPCPDVTQPEGGFEPYGYCFRCVPPMQERGTFPLQGAVVYGLLWWGIRRRRPR